MVALAIFWALPGAICEGGFPTVISLRGRQHFWICSFLVSTVWRSQHKISEYLVDGISSALKSWVFISHNVAFFEYWVCQEKQWISGYHCQNYKNLDAYPKRRSSASLLNSFVHFFFFCRFLYFFLYCFVFVVFIDQKCAALLFRTKMVSIGYFDNDGKIWDPSLVKEMKMKNKNLAKKPYS